MRQTTGIFSKPVNGRRPCLRGVQLLRRQGGGCVFPPATPPTNAPPSFPVIGSSQHQPALIHHTPHTTHRSTRQARAGASARLRRRRRRSPLALVAGAAVRPECQLARSFDYSSWYVSVYICPVWHPRNHHLAFTEFLTTRLSYLALSAAC